jgi:hypothetical protein
MLKYRNGAHAVLLPRPEHPLAFGLKPPIFGFPGLTALFGSEGLRGDGPKPQNSPPEKDAADSGDSDKLRPYNVETCAAIEDRLSEGYEMRRGRHLHHR